MDRLLKDKQVAIIGGGPGGLMLARLLVLQGVNVKVYERDADRHVRQQGSTLDMHYDTGLKALTAAGLLEEFKKYYRPGADKAVIVNSQMDIIYDEHQGKPQEDFGDESFRPEIDRGPLRDLLIASLREETIVWNARFTGMEASGDGWEVFFDNGSSAYADLVIGSDGANSGVRRYITSIGPVYSGVTSMEGNIYQAAIHTPKLWQLAKGGSLFALENGRTISFITRGDGTLTFLIGLKRPENWLAGSGIDLTNRHSAAAWFAAEFADWSPAWQELFASDALTLVPRIWYHFPADQHWETLPNLTMIGDAAHRIPAYAGEGANQALADALDLSEALGSGQFETTGQAIAFFEQNMLRRSAVATEESLHNTESLHAENNLEFLMDLFGIRAGRPDA
jgi:2-polyprenyl-6-methoxyphenol hydroxylase-like FAD-dependent oxidoreductase